MSDTRGDFMEDIGSEMQRKVDGPKFVTVDKSFIGDPKRMLDIGEISTPEEMNAMKGEVLQRVHSGKKEGFGGKQG